MCGLSTLYCCYTVGGEAVDTRIPARWPPHAQPVPDKLRGADLSCAAGSCAQWGPPGAPATSPSRAPAQPPAGAAAASPDSVHGCPRHVLHASFLYGGRARAGMACLLPRHDMTDRSEDHALHATGCTPSLLDEVLIIYIDHVGCVACAAPSAAPSSAPRPQPPPELAPLTWGAASLAPGPGPPPLQQDSAVAGQPSVQIPVAQLITAYQERATAQPPALAAPAAHLANISTEATHWKLSPGAIGGIAGNSTSFCSVCGRC